MGLVHPRFISQLAAYFPTQAAIQQPVETRDTDGAVLTTWTTVAGLDALQCAVGFFFPHHELRRPRQVEVIATHRILLAGYYPQITPAMRLVTTDGRTFDITEAFSDSQQVATALVARIVLETG